MDAVGEIRRRTQGKGIDVAIEALGRQATFESALRALRAGGALSSLGVYSGKLSVPLEPFAAGLGDHKIVTTLCPGGKERMRRLMELVRHGRLDLRPRIAEAYELFGQRRDGVIKVAIRPL
jgi:alcohol dehydrogenase